MGGPRQVRRGIASRSDTPRQANDIKSVMIYLFAFPKRAAVTIQPPARGRIRAAALHLISPHPMTAPEQLVDLFERPFQPTQSRDATDGERAANLAAGQHISSASKMEVPYGQEIQNSVDAARWAATHHASNALCDHLADQLPTNLGYKRLRRSMPKTTPVPIRNYRQRGASSRTDGFFDAVANNAATLALGQVI